MLHGTPVLFALPLAIAPPKLCLHNVALCLQKWRIITLCKIAALPTLEHLTQNEITGIFD